MRGNAFLLFLSINIESSKSDTPFPLFPYFPFIRHCIIYIIWELRTHYGIPKGTEG